MYLHLNRLGKFHLCHFSVLSYLHSIWTPLEGGSVDMWHWPSYLWSLLCPVLRWSVRDIPVYHPLAQRVPVHPLFIRPTPQRRSVLKCRNGFWPEAESPSHLWVVISNLLNNSYLFSISLPITGLFVIWAPTQTPCCSFLLPCNICIAIYSFFLNRVTPVFHYRC